MHFKTFNLLAILSAVLFLSSCADTTIKRNLADDWWPIHATGTFDDGYFTASWDSDLGARGGLFITFTNKTDPSLKYDDVWYFDALSFAKDHKTFQYISIRNLDYETSRALKYYIKDKKIYFEIKNEAGRGTGEYGEGKDIKFLDDDRVLIDGVTYERYEAHVRRLAAEKDATRPLITPEGRIPVSIYQ